MNTLYIIALSLLLQLFAHGTFAQLTTEYYNHDFKRCNKDTATYYRKITYDKNHHPVGLVYDYYMNGSPQWVGKLLSSDPDVIDSIATWYYENGKMWERSNYKDGKKGGLYEYYAQAGYLQERGFYKNDAIDGHLLRYYRSGKLNWDELYRHGKPDSLRVCYYESGKIKYIESYKDTLMNGEARSYYDNGVLQQRFMMVNGKQKGFIYDYYASGKLEDSVYAEIMQKNGNYFRLYESGILREKGVYKKGSREGEYVNCDEDGRIVEKSYYVNGMEEKQYTCTFNSKTDSIYTIRHYFNSTARMDSTFFGNGRVKEVINYTNGVPASSTEYNIDGRVIGFLLPANKRLTIKRDDARNRFGLTDSAGRWVVPAQYDFIDSHKEYFIVKQNGYSGVLGADGKVAIPAKYEDIKEAIFTAGPDDEDEDTEMAVPDKTPQDIFVNLDKLFVVMQNGKYGITNFQGRVIVTPKYGFMGTNSNYGLLQVRNNGLTGWIDAQGREVVKPLYKNISNICIPNLVEFGDGDLHGVINLKGDTIVPMAYNQIYCRYPRQKFIWVRRDTSFALYSVNGKMILPPVYHDVYKEGFNYMFNKNVRRLSNSQKKIGVVNDTGKIIIPFEYDKLDEYWYGKPHRRIKIYKAEKQGKWGIVDSMGNAMVALQYDYVRLDVIYNYAADTAPITLFVVCKAGRMGVVSISNDIVVPFNYDVIGNGWDGSGEAGVFYLYNENKLTYKIIEKSPAEKYWASLPAKRAICFRLIDCNGKRSTGLARKDGEIIIPPYSDYDVEQWQNYYAIIDPKGNRFIVDVNGNKISRKYWYIHTTELDRGGNSVVESAGHKLGIINSNDSLIVDTLYYGLAQFTDGIGWLKTNPGPLNTDSTMEDYFGDEGNKKVFYGRWRMTDDQGKFISDSIFICPVRFNEKKAVAETTHGKVLLKTDGSLVIQGCYNKIEKNNDDGLWHLEKTDTTIIYNDVNDKITRVPCGRVSSFFGKYAIAEKNSGKALVSTEDGKIVTPFYKDGLAACPWNLNDSLLFDVTFSKGVKFTQKITESNSEQLGRLDSIENKKMKQSIINRMIDKYVVQFLDPKNPKEDNDSLENVYDGYFYFPEMFNRESYGCGQDYNINVWLVDYTANTYSINVTTDTSYYCTRGMGSSISRDTFFNYGFYKNGQVGLTLDSILIINDNTKEKINAILSDSLKKYKRYDGDWDSLAYFNGMKNRFSIGKEGITFYHPIMGNDYNNNSTEPQVTIHYTALVPYVKKKWLNK